MADIASLLMAQQHSNKSNDPLAQQRRYAQLLMQQGAESGPIRSPWQGAARAAQSVLGGLLAGRADQQAETDRKSDIQGLAALLSANSPEEMAQAAGKLRNTDLAAPLLAQALGERQKTMQAQKAGGDWRTAVTAPPPGTQSAAGPQTAGAPQITSSALPCQPLLVPLLV